MMIILHLDSCGRTNRFGNTTFTATKIDKIKGKGFANFTFGDEGNKMQIDIYSAENEGQRYQNMLLMGKTLDDLGYLLDEALGILQRRTLDTSWFCGKVLCKAKEDAGHGQWIPWLSARGISQSTAKRLMSLYTEYPQIAQLGRFESVDAALKALAPKPQPKQIAEPEPTPEPELPNANQANGRISTKSLPDPATTEPLTAFDTVTGKETEVARRSHAYSRGADQSASAARHRTRTTGRARPQKSKGGQHTGKAKKRAPLGDDAPEHQIQQRGQWVRGLGTATT